MFKHKKHHKILMREILWIDKTLKTIQGELVNNGSKLMEINKHIKKESNK